MKKSLVQECAENKFINNFSKLPLKIAEPIYQGNSGFSVEMTFADHRLPDCLVKTVASLTWKEVDDWVAKKRKARL